MAPGKVVKQCPGWKDERQVQCFGDVKGNGSIAPSNELHRLEHTELEAAGRTVCMLTHPSSSCTIPYHHVLGTSDQNKPVYMHRGGYLMEGMWRMPR